MIAFFLLACEPIAPWPVVVDRTFEDERILVTPARLDFGEVSATMQGESRRSFEIANLGTDPVTVTGHDEPVGDAEVFRIDAPPLLTLEAGESVTLDALFTPGTERAALAHVRFEPGSEALELVGIGHAPVLTVGDTSVPATVLGCSGSGAVGVQNDGTESLTLAASVTGDDYQLTGWPPELAPGQASFVEITFTPGGSGQRGGVLTLASNDPARPELPVTLSALGYEGARVTEQFRYAPTVPTDVLFVVEGGVFGGDPRVAEAAEAWATRVHDSFVSVQMTSVSSGDACPSRRPFYSDVGDSILRLATIAGQGFDGAGGRWDEDLLGLAVEALARTGTADCLEGFRRTGAALDVVVVALTPPADDAIASASALADTLPDGTRLRVSAIVPGSSACGGGTSGYAQVPALYGGALGDACDTSWVSAFERLADFPPSDDEVRYPLAEEPVRGTVEVDVDGVAFTGWSWNADGNEVVVPPETAPPLGSTLTVTYVSAVACAG